MNDEEGDYLLGLDLGQASDYTALAVLQRRQRPDPDHDGWYLDHFAVRHLQRWPLGTSYPAIIDDLKEMVSGLPLKHCTLGVDQTGVGRAVVDMIRQADFPVHLQPVLITAGHQITLGDDGSHHVPKKELVSTVQALLQTRRIKCARLPEGDTLVQELLAFQVKVTVSANETFEARERAHDDLVLAVAIAAWLGDRGALCAGAGPVLVERPSDPSRPFHSTPRKRGCPWGDAH